MIHVCVCVRERGDNHLGVVRVLPKWSEHSHSKEYINHSAALWENDPNVPGVLKILKKLDI